MTKIEWVKNADGSQGKTWNPVTGCSKISPGCANCYAERMSKRLAGRFGYPVDEPFRVTLHRDRLDEPLRWKKPQTVFVVSMGDLFHDDVPDVFLDQVFAIMAKASHHIFIVLTKRPERMRDYIVKSMFDEDCCYQGWYEAIGGLGIPDVAPMQNIWLGVTAENQEQADKRIPLLLRTPAAVRFVSVEPMLGPVDLTRWFEASQWCNCCTRTSYGTPDGICPYCGDSRTREGRNGLHWVVCGCESGPKRRYTDIEWMRSLRNQCEMAGVPFFLKQMEVNGKLVKMPEFDGKVWREMPTNGRSF